MLVLEPHPRVRMVTRECLRSWGLVCESASSVAEARGLLAAAQGRGEAFEVAMLSTTEPDALDLAEELHGAGPDAGPARILVLPFGHRLDANLARRLGVEIVTNRPVRSSALRRCLLRALGITSGGLDDRPDAARPAAGPTTRAFHRRAVVLVAEDNAVNQKVAIRLLDRLGYRCDVVADGAEALEALGRIEYAAVLMDCMMPVMDGYAATKARRLQELADPSGRRTPIIAMTANAWPASGPTAWPRAWTTTSRSP